MQIPAQLQPVLEGVKHIHSTGHFSDLKIVCRGREWNVHKFWMCAQSEFFRSACNGKFIEGKENTITLDDDDPQVVEALIHYLYNFEYGDCTNEPTSIAPIVLDVRMYVLADKYFFAPLKTLAVQKFRQRAVYEWPTSEFADAIAEVYQSTTAGEANPLKSAIVKAIKAQSRMLFNTSAGYERFFEVVGEIAELGREVSQALSGGFYRIPDDFDVYKCPECGVAFAIAQDVVTFDCKNDCNDDRSVVWWSKFKVSQYQGRGELWHLIER